MRLPRCLTSLTPLRIARSTACTCAALSLLISLLATGCATNPSASHPVMLSTEPWTYEGRPARNLRTVHYLIHTTITDEKFLQRLAQSLESSLQQYRDLAPDV